MFFSEHNQALYSICSVFLVLKVHKIGISESIGMCKSRLKVWIEVFLFLVHNYTQLNLVEWVRFKADDAFRRRSIAFAIAIRDARLECLCCRRRVDESDVTICVFGESCRFIIDQNVWELLAGKIDWVMFLVMDEISLWPHSTHSHKKQSRFLQIYIKKQYLLFKWHIV